MMSEDFNEGKQIYRYYFLADNDITKDDIGEQGEPVQRVVRKLTDNPEEAITGGIYAFEVTEINVDQMTYFGHPLFNSISDCLTAMNYASINYVEIHSKLQNTPGDIEYGFCKECRISANMPIVTVAWIDGSTTVYPMDNIIKVVSRLYNM